MTENLINIISLVLLTAVAICVLVGNRRPKPPSMTTTVTAHEECAYCSDHWDATATTGRAVSMALDAVRTGHMRRWHPETIDTATTVNVTGDADPAATARAVEASIADRIARQ